MGKVHVFRFCVCTQMVQAPYFTLQHLLSLNNFHFKALAFFISLWRKCIGNRDYSPELTLSLCMRTEEQALALQYTPFALDTTTPPVSIWVLLILCHWAKCLIHCSFSKPATQGEKTRSRWFLTSVAVMSWGPAWLKKKKQGTHRATGKEWGLLQSRFLFCINFF